MAKLQTSIILEILGRPKEHVTEALTSLVEKVGTEKGVKIIEKTIHEPILVEGAQNLFTTFADVLLELDSLDNYFGVMFAYMPSHIEIISPEKIILENIDLNTLGNKLMQRLHDYDALTKKVIMEHDIALKKLQEIAPDLVSDIPSPVTQQQTQAQPQQAQEVQKKKKFKRKSKR